MPASPGRELGEQGGVPGVLTPHNGGFNPCCLEAWFFHLIDQGHLFVWKTEALLMAVQYSTEPHLLII